MNLTVDKGEIILDIDNTTTTTIPRMIEYCRKFNDEEGIDLPINQKGFNESTLFAWTTEQKMKFCRKYIEEVVSQVPIKEFAPEILNLLREQGYKITVLTARKKPNFKDPYGLTKGYLDSHKIPYDTLLVGCEDKLTYCLEHNVKMVFDDEPQNIMPISEAGIPVIVFRGMHNEDCIGDNIVKVNNWPEVAVAVKLYEQGQKLNSDIDISKILSEANHNGKDALQDVLGNTEHLRKGLLDAATRFIRGEIHNEHDKVPVTVEER